MAIQDGFGKLGFFEDFQGIAASAAITDGTAGTQYNDITISAISSNLTFDFTTSESGGVATFDPDDAATDSGAALVSSPMVPSSNGPLVVVARIKTSVITDYRIFLGWQETVALVEPVTALTLSGTGITANAAGQVVGFYFDADAEVDDFRFMAASGGAASTTAAVSYAREGSTTLGSLGIRCGASVATGSWITLRVEIDPSGQVRGYLGAAGMGNQTGLTHIATLKAGAIDQDAVYFPILLMSQHSSGDPTHSVDYFGAKGNRDWTA